MDWYINSMGDAHNLSHIESLIVTSSEDRFPSLMLPDKEKRKYFDDYMILVQGSQSCRILEFVSEYDEGKKLISYILSRTNTSRNNVIRYEEVIPMLV